LATRSFSIAGGDGGDDVEEGEELPLLLLLLLDRALLFTESCWSQQRQAVGAARIPRRLLTAIEPLRTLTTI
jgi:hypothetical protein